MCSVLGGGIAVTYRLFALLLLIPLWATPASTASAAPAVAAVAAVPVTWSGAVSVTYDIAAARPDPNHPINVRKLAVTSEGGPSLAYRAEMQEFLYLNGGCAGGSGQTDSWAGQQSGAVAT